MNQTEGTKILELQTVQSQERLELNKNHNQQMINLVASLIVIEPPPIVVPPVPSGRKVIVHANGGGTGGGNTNGLSNAFIIEQMNQLPIYGFTAHSAYSWQALRTTATANEWISEYQRIMQFKPKAKLFIPLFFEIKDPVNGIPKFATWETDMSAFLINWRSAVTAAKSLGSGVFWDTEVYGAGPWEYRNNFYMTDYQGQIHNRYRQFGARLGEIVNELYPDLEILWTQDISKGNAKANAEILHRGTRGLYPADYELLSPMLQGFIETAAQASKADGGEYYGLREPLEFKEATAHRRSINTSWINPDTVTWSYGIYNAAFASNPATQRPMNPDIFQKATRAALDASGHCWPYLQGVGAEAYFVKNGQPTHPYMQAIVKAL